MRKCIKGAQLLCTKMNNGSIIVRVNMEIQDITKPAVLIGEEASFKEALSMMVTQKTNTLLVVDSDGKLTGEVGVSNLLDAIVPDYLNGDSIAANFATREMPKEAVTDAEEKQVQFFMSRELTPIDFNDSLMSVAAIAIANNQVRTPVIDADNRPIGIISRQGLKRIIAEHLGIKDSA